MKDHQLWILLTFGMGFMIGALVVIFAVAVAARR